MIHIKMYEIIRLAQSDSVLDTVEVTLRSEVDANLRAPHEMTIRVDPADANQLRIGATWALALAQDSDTP